MANFLRWVTQRYKWKWVGTVKGECAWTNKGQYVGVTDYVFWDLWERGDGKRRADVTGNPKWAPSPQVLNKQAQIKAWLKGAPIPDLYRKSEIAKPKAKLIVFNGGK